MDTYTAVPAYVRKGFNGLVLVDISRLSFLYGVPHDRPVSVSKTALHGDFTDGWCFYLEEVGTRTALIKSSDTDHNSKAIDLIELLGHGLTVMPSQKLVFACTGDCVGVTYVDLMPSLKR